MTAAIGLIVGLALAASGVFGQGMDLIDLDVHARDAHGQPVTDLTADQIRVFEDGRPQKVAFVQHWSTSATPSAGRWAPRQFSNRSENRRPMAVVVLNLLDAGVQSLQVSETFQAIEQLEAGSDLYLYVVHRLSGALLAIHALPSKPENANAPSELWASGATKQVKEILRLKPSFDEIERTSDSNTRIAAAQAAIESLASQMARLPGEKSLVWIGALPLSPRSDDWGNTEYGRAMTGNMGRLLALLDSAGAAVYEVRMSRWDAAISGMPNPNPYVERPTVANVTGGRKYVDEIGRAVADAVSDAREGYRVFYAPNDRGGGSYRKIKLVSMRRGVTLHGQQGYDRKMIVPPHTAREIIDSLTATLREGPDIGLRATADVASAVDGKLQLMLSIDPADLLFASGHAELSMQVVDYAKDGRTLTAADPKQLEAVRDRLTFPIEVTFNGSSVGVRVIVCDRTTGLAGTLTIPLAGIAGAAR